MIINYVKLKNIGPYIGTHMFNLSTDSQKNLILFGGKNGSGKTTLIKAIKYGLFGSFSLGLKTNTDSYFEEIKQLLNNSTKGDCYIEISFEYVENFESQKYVIKRMWKAKSGIIEEKVSVTSADGKTNQDPNEIIDKIKAISSPQLINSFMFDGEKIGNIIENGTISSYLRDVFDSIFGINLIKQTKKDLNNYLDKRASESKIKVQIDNMSYVSKIESIKSDLDSINNNLKKHKSSISNLKTIKKSNTEKFYSLGGLSKAKIDEINKKIDSFTDKKEEMNKKIKEYVENDLPLFLIRDLVEKARIQCINERQAKYLDYLREIEQFLNEDLTAIFDKLNKSIISTKIIHSLNDSQVESMEHRLSSALESTNKIRPFLLSKNTNYDQYKIMKKQLQDNENIESFNNLIEENKKIDDSISILEAEIKTFESKLIKLDDELKLYYSLYEKTNDQIKKDSLVDKSFVIGKDSIDICDKFIEQITNSKLKAVSKYATSVFNDAIRKIDYLKDIIINNDFSISLSNCKNQIIDVKTLSAGEMQILVSSLIWSMFKVSGRREMFIFDTPLARLDKENRIGFITKILSTISPQVIVLSTDSEFVGNNLLPIKDRVNKYYLLEYNQKGGTSVSTNTYFMES